MFQIIKEKQVNTCGRETSKETIQAGYRFSAPTLSQTHILGLISVMIRTSTLFSTFHVYLTKWLTRNPHILLDQRWGRLRDSSLVLREDRRTTIKQRPYPRKRNKVPKWSYVATQAFRT